MSQAGQLVFRRRETCDAAARDCCDWRNGRARVHVVCAVLCLGMPRRKFPVERSLVVTLVESGLAAAREYQAGKIVRVEKQESNMSSGADPPLKTDVVIYRVSIQQGNKFTSVATKPIERTTLMDHPAIQTKLLLSRFYESF